MSEPDIERLMRENDILRARLAKHECIYGHQSKGGVCNLGYPGCACADDIFVGEETMFKMWRVKVEVLKESLRKLLSSFASSNSSEINAVMEEARELLKEDKLTGD